MNARNLIRWTGVAAMAAGVIFAAIQPIHPPDELASVTTGAWAVIIAFKLAMCLLFLLGIAGLYARQVETTGWLGLAGFLLLIVSWWLQTGFVFAELFLLPLLATQAPTFVDGLLGTIAAGRASEADLGVLPALYTLGVGIPYMLGGLLFGIATFRAGVLPRWAGGLLAVSGPLAMLMVALLPHQLERFAAMPMGFAMAWLGYALWAEQRETVAEPVLSAAGS
ncbi:MAG TPA: hypothetical protein PKD53_22935 [Chloroflexaceae bacterium]|nr:hypothetical protein [Chloroflexaceae bacterium]